MNVNSIHMFNVTNINFVLIYIKYTPIFGNFSYREEFKLLATAN